MKTHPENRKNQIMNLDKSEFLCGLAYPDALGPRCSLYDATDPFAQFWCI